MSGNFTHSARGIPCLFQLPLFSLLLATLCFLFAAAPLRAEDLFYDGSNPGLLRFVPLVSGIPQSLVPFTPSNNRVTVTGGSIFGGVAGGVDAGALDVTDNRVIISGGFVFSDVLGGRAVGGRAARNSLLLSGGAVGGIFGADLVGGHSDSGNAEYNDVTISGGTIVGSIYGGSSAAGDAVFNTVTLAGNVNLDSVVVYGGFDRNPATLNDVFTGNTLIVDGFRGSVFEVNNFQRYSLSLPASLGSGQTLISIVGPTPTTMNNTTVAMALIGGGEPQPGDRFVLIDRVTGAPTNSSVEAPRGVALLYDFDLSTAGGVLEATLRGSRVNPQAKILPGSRLTGLAFVLQGTDLLVGPGIRAAVDTRPACEGAVGLAPFAVMQGGRSRYNIGSHVDVNSLSLLTGLALRPTDPAGGTTLAAFVEAGRGDYDSHHEFSGRASVSGGGDASYYGGGILGRYDFFAGPYIEASAHAGWTSTDFRSDDLRDHRGRGASYDADAPYYGAHIGLGYRLSPSDTVEMDVFAKYLWTHQRGESLDVANEPIDFLDAESHRLRGGARFEYALNERLAPYVGAYYDYELDGKAESAARGRAIDAPSLRGGTVAGEMGLSVRPAAGCGFSLDLGLQGYTGVREGVTGSLGMRWDF